ncbi:MAG: aminotransferase class I/II-fold pyridoxal phosphate-dependent enzyme [Neisseriaceae bacterium]
MKIYPLNDFSKIKRHVREFNPNIVNLKTCELLHPDINKILDNITFYGTDYIRIYPHFNDIINHISTTLKIDHKTITLSAGSDPIISIIIEALGATTKRMILQSPNYFSWHNYPILRNLNVTEVSFNSSNSYKFCINEFLKVLTSAQPSLVVISNPNSPTGYLFSAEDLLKLSMACEANGHLLIIDECFVGFSSIDNYDIIGPKEHVIFIKSFSKIYGIAGARIALTIASERITEHLSYWRPEAAVSGHALLTLEQILKYKDQLKVICLDIANTREYFISCVKKIKPDWISVPSGANFVVFCLSEEYNSSTIVDIFLAHGFRIADVSSLPGLANCIRIGIGHLDIMTKVINIIEKYI